MSEDIHVTEFEGRLQRVSNVTMKSIDHYIKLFSKLKRSPHAVWGDATKNKAPHKPILLLSVIDLISRGLLKSNFIDLKNALSELNDLFNSYWSRVVPLGQTSSVAFPFSRLHNEGFWKLVPLAAVSSFRKAPEVSTVPQLREVALGAEIENDLFFCMQDARNRNALRQALLQSSFSEEAQKELESQAMINANAYSYSLELIQKSHEPIVSDIIKSEYNKKSPARDQGFRRAVVTTYDHRCALCGVRMVTPEGHTAVDAAHIKPWSISQNDDIRNGMALCKLCHWTFDEGFIGVSKSYTVLVSHQLSSGSNMSGLLSTLNHRSIITPVDKELWPEQTYLDWHRKEFKLDKP